MRINLGKVFAFTAGAAIGSAVTWKLLKTKYERIAQEEIESVKETFSRLYETQKDDTSGEDAESDEEDESEFREEDYTEYAEHIKSYTGSDKLTAKEIVSTIRPYIISPEEFDEIEDYETVTLYYYDDGVLADADGEPIGNIDDVIGLEALDHFGDFAENAVYVRNDRIQADYEILRSLQNYTEIDDDETEYS